MVIFEQFEHFQKTGFRNRYQVLGANGNITLSIPVIGGRETRDLTRVVKIDNRLNWQNNHWKTLESCYNKSPFFFHYAPGLQALFQNKFDNLWEFNLEAFSWVIKQLKIDIKTSFSTEFNKNMDGNTTRDLRGLFKTSARETYHHTPYFQVFETGFQQNLSILDLLFNLGPQTASYLRNQPII